MAVSVLAVADVAGVAQYDCMGCDKRLTNWCCRAAVMPRLVLLRRGGVRRVDASCSALILREFSQQKPWTCGDDSLEGGGDLGELQSFCRASGTPGLEDARPNSTHRRRKIT